MTDNPKSEDFKEFLLKNNIDVNVSNARNYLGLAFNLLSTLLTFAFILFHEAGHALSVKLLTDNDVPKVTIIPSTSGIGGVNIPKKMGLITKDELLNNVRVLYAGRAAELILKKDEGQITTGA
ncbi:MAG TPA: hypothetical protein GX005_03315, partial [Bacteroidales bacterium]|nr:hypothetical protein [Bacteroidales bacterium]